MFPSLALALLVSSAVVSAIHARSNHASLAKRLETSLTERDTYSGTEFTWYPTNTGADACTGKDHSDNDWFVAMGYDQFGDGGCCGKKMRIDYNGKSAIAQCVDECASCPQWGQLDFTKGLFEYLAGDLGIGVLHGSWSYVDNDSELGPVKAAPPPAPTTHKTTTTHKPTSTTKKPTSTPHPSSSTQHSSSAKLTPTSSSAKPSSSASASAAESASSTDDSLLPSATDGVANVGSGVGGSSAGTSGDSDSSSGSTGIQGALTGTNGAAALASSKLSVVVAALALVAFHAL